MLKKIIAWFKSIFETKEDKPSPSVRRGLLERIAMPEKSKRVKVQIYKMIRKTACGHHAVYTSNVGDIRKPIQP